MRVVIDGDEQTIHANQLTPESYTVTFRDDDMVAVYDEKTLKYRALDLADFVICDIEADDLEDLVRKMGREQEYAAEAYENAEVYLKLCFNKGEEK